LLNYLNFEYVTHACQARAVGAAYNNCVPTRGPTCQGTDALHQYQHTLILKIEFQFLFEWWCFAKWFEKIHHQKEHKKEKTVNNNGSATYQTLSILHLLDSYQRREIIGQGQRKSFVSSGW
jgi:hypothetical protein